MTVSGLPSRNVQFLLLIIDSLGRVEGRVKLFKLHHILETEAKVKFDCPDEEQKMGYTQFAALEDCMNAGYIQESACPGFVRDRYDYALTPNGKELVEIIKKDIKPSELQSINRVIGKYRDLNGRQLIEYTHKNLIDDFKLSDAKKYSKEYIAVLDELQVLSKKFVGPTGNTEAYVMSGRLEHVKRILAAMPENAKKKVQVGTIVIAVRELVDTLKAKLYVPDETSKELFEYIDNYADKEGILSSLSSDDFSTLSDDEKKCLAEFLGQVQLPLSS